MAKTILVADDERHIVRLIQTHLERENYTVVTAFDGQEALEKIETERFDLIILDTMMPLMDGFEVVQTLKKDPLTRGIPLIMLTAKAPDADIFKGWDMGVNGYLSKPFPPAELLAFVRRVFERIS